MATGTVIVSFGAFPGSDTASLAITGQTSILNTSKVEAYVDPTAGSTSDHSVDEHIAVDIDVRCSNIVAGTGFTINLATRSLRQIGGYNITWVWA